jgi:hypothetical protein
MHRPQQNNNYKNLLSYLDYTLNEPDDGDDKSLNHMKVACRDRH